MKRRRITGDGAGAKDQAGQVKTVIHEAPEGVQVRGEVCVCIYDAASGALKERHITRNIVTDAGDQYIAQRMAEENPTNFVDGSFNYDGIMELATAGSAPAKGSNRSAYSASAVANSQKAADATYPQTNDPDGDNPGTVGIDVWTHRTSYTTAEANATGIDRLAITNPTPGATEPLLGYALFSGGSFDKTASDTMKAFYNVTITGV